MRDNGCHEQDNITNLTKQGQATYKGACPFILWPKVSLIRTMQKNYAKAHFAALSSATLKSIGQYLKQQQVMQLAVATLIMYQKALLNLKPKL